MNNNAELVGFSQEMLANIWMKDGFLPIQFIYYFVSRMNVYAHVSMHMRVCIALIFPIWGQIKFLLLLQLNVVWRMVLTSII